MMRFHSTNSLLDNSGSMPVVISLSIYIYIYLDSDMYAFVW